MIAVLGGTSVAGGKMKSTKLWDSPNTGATNSSNFSALGAGMWNPAGTPYTDEGNFAAFWTTSFDTKTNSNIFYWLTKDSEAAKLQEASKLTGMSCRCVKDN